MKYLSLFSGIGGFELGIGVKAECIGYSEIDKYAIKIYESHFKHKAYGDITKIVESELPDFDLICGGFPCQSFSIAGKRGGFEDTRGTLFFDIARIIRVKKPRLIFLENVKGLLSHDQGNTFATIIATLDELGYDLQWQVLNSKNFGVPQNRERVFIIGHLRGTSRPQVFPIKQDGQTNDKRYRQKSTLRARDYASWKGNFLKYEGAILSSKKNKKWLEDGKSKSRNFPQGQRVYNPNGISTTLASQAGGLGSKTGLYEIEQNKIRRLTPTESERLQGFPDGWTEGISDSQRYKCLGNAVTVNVIKTIVKNLCLTH